MTHHDEKGTPTCANCNGRLVWWTVPALPFPEVATEAQKRLQERGGLWVHRRPSGGPPRRKDQHCSPMMALPKKVPDEVSYSLGWKAGVGWLVMEHSTRVMTVVETEAEADEMLTDLQAPRSAKNEET